MIFVFVSLIGCYKKSFHLSPDSKQKLPDYFHFQSNGEYLIEVDASNQKVFPINIDVSICTKSEYKRFNTIKNRYCSTNYNLFIESHENISKVSGTIKKRGSYQILIFSSKYSVHSTVSITLRNPKSYLDFYLQPCLYIEPVFLSIFVLFMILWIINTVQYIFYNFAMLDFNYHTILTCSFIIIILTSIFRIFLLWKWHLHNENNPFGIIELVFIVIEKIIIFNSIHLSAKGMNIINDKISMREQVNIFFDSFFISLSFLHLEEDMSFFDYFLIIIISFYILCVYDSFMKMIMLTKRKLIAHLYVINEEGIEPKSTPIYEKYLLFEKISFFLVSYFCCFIFIQYLLRFCCVYALNLILNDLFLLFFALPLAWFYRYRKEMKRGYMKLEEIELKTKPKRMLNETINKIKLSTFLKEESENGYNAKKIIWTDGMQLPPCPVIVDGLADYENLNGIHLNQNIDDVDKKDPESVLQQTFF